MSRRTNPSITGGHQDGQAMRESPKPPLLARRWSRHTGTRPLPVNPDVEGPPPCGGGPSRLVYRISSRFYGVTLKALVPPGTYVHTPKFETVALAIATLQRTGREMAIVTDRGGQMLGIVTLRDLIEAIVGEMAPND